MTDEEIKQAASAQRSGYDERYRAGFYDGARTMRASKSTNCYQTIREMAEAEKERHEREMAIIRAKVFAGRRK